MKMESLISIGLILLLIGFILIVIGSVSSAIKGKTDVKSAGIIFIGPFPMGWASDKKMFYALMGFTLLLIILWFILRKYI